MPNTSFPAGVVVSIDAPCPEKTGNQRQGIKDREFYHSTTDNSNDLNIMSDNVTLSDLIF